MRILTDDQFFPKGFILRSCLELKKTFKCVTQSYLRVNKETETIKRALLSQQAELLRNPSVLSKSKAPHCF